MTNAHLTSTLRQMDFCREMSDADLAQLASIAQEREYRRGDVLFREGDQAVDLYLIVGGEVGLSVHGPHVGDRYVMSVGAGDMVGWSTVLERARMTDTARALTPTPTIVVDGNALLKLCHDNPAFGCTIMRRTAQAIAARLSATRLKMLEMCGVQLPTSALESD